MESTWEYRKNIAMKNVEKLKKWKKLGQKITSNRHNFLENCRRDDLITELNSQQKIDVG